MCLSYGKYNPFPIIILKIVIDCHAFVTIDWSTCRSKND